MRRLALLVGVLVAIAGLTGLIYPSALLALARNSVTPPALYVVAVLRIAFGLIFIAASSMSRMPRVVRVLGVIVIVAGAATPLMGADRASAMMAWWAAQGPAFARATGGLVVLVAALLIYAIGPRRRSIPA